MGGAHYAQALLSKRSTLILHAACFLIGAPSILTVRNCAPNASMMAATAAGTHCAPPAGALRDALLDAAAAHGTPLYAYDLGTVRARLAALADALDAGGNEGGADAADGAGVRFALLYALKANNCAGVVRAILGSRGVAGLDCVSVGEVALALALGSRSVLYTNCNVSRAEMDAVLALAGGHPSRPTLYVNVDSLHTLGVDDDGGRSSSGVVDLADPACLSNPAVFDAARCWLPRGTSVFLRVNGPVGGGHHAHVITCGPRSKFGVPHAHVATALAAADAAGLRVVGLHQHIGSGVREPDTLGRAAGVLLGVAGAALAAGGGGSSGSRHPLRHLRFLNLGGGLGTPYRPGEAPLPLAGLGASLRAKCAGFAAALAAARAGWAAEEGGTTNGDGGGLTVLLEPGRFPVAEAGYLLLSATSVKTVPADDHDGERSGGAGAGAAPTDARRHRTFLGVDSGFNHLVRPLVYGAYHHISVLGRRGSGGSRGGDGHHSGADSAGAPAAAGALRPYYVAGNVCESGDVFTRADAAVPGTRDADHWPPRAGSASDAAAADDDDADANPPGPRLLPRVGPGDVLAVHGAGAYGAAMASEYNLRPRPAEVVLVPVTGGAADAATGVGGYRVVLARRRRTVQELVADALGEPGAGDGALAV